MRVFALLSAAMATMAFAAPSADASVGNDLATRADLEARVSFLSQLNF